METELTHASPLLTREGCLTQVGWARQPLLDCNLEAARFYPLPWFQPLRIKRWDYYAVFTPQRFFSATISHLGYAANLFVYTLDFESGRLHEEGIVAPLGKGVDLPRNSTTGTSSYRGAKAQMRFDVQPGWRTLSVDWPAYQDGRGLRAEIALACPPAHESMNIVIPIGRRRFYYNRKINCLPAQGFLQIGQESETLEPTTAIGSLDWGRGVWEYASFWNWASSSGFLPDGRSVGLNFGCGFGDLSAAGENALILDGRIHKLGPVRFDYVSGDWMRPWRFTDRDGRLDLTFTPFKERVARTNLGLIFSEVHQMFGRYHGQVVSDTGETLHLEGLIGFAEEHWARW